MKKHSKVRQLVSMKARFCVDIVHCVATQLSQGGGPHCQKIRLAKALSETIHFTRMNLMRDKRVKKISSKKFIDYALVDREKKQPMFLTNHHKSLFLTPMPNFTAMPLRFEVLRCSQNQTEAALKSMVRAQ